MLRAIILVIALGAAGGAAWIASEKTASAPVAVVAEQVTPEMTAILVAAEDIPRGRQVTASAMKWQQWPSDALASSFIDLKVRPEAVKEFSGQFANRPISAGEPVADWAFTVGPNGFLAATLAPGMRAVAIDVNAQSTAGGFILPNDRVDVLHTMPETRNLQGSEIRSRTILRGVRVLAIDQTTEDTNSGTVLGKTATLELTEAQVEYVTAAASTGTLSLALRPLEDFPAEASMVVEQPTKTIRVRRGTVVEDFVVN